MRAEVKRFHAISGGSAGERSISDMLTNEGYPLSRYRVENLMTELNLVSCQIPKHNYKKAIKEQVAIPNILKRQFAAVEPDTYWCGDVTYIWTGTRWPYLAVVLDLFSRKVIGWALSNLPVERFFRSLKTEWIPTIGYKNFTEAKVQVKLQNCGQYYLTTSVWHHYLG
ncbi:MAG: DDE-type integrase/transposase/recombinase [Colwellia sp.]|nr:DDE-type integrase/transposase/recombinase [Colwellia sp.]